MKKIKIFSNLLLMSLVACGGGGGSDDSSGESSGSISGDKLATACGFLDNGRMVSSVDVSKGRKATLVSVLDSNALILNVGGTERIIKLLGIGSTTGFNNTAAEEKIQEIAAEELTFYSAGGCTATVANGAVAEVGQVITASGKSMTEELIKAHVVGVIETTGTCNESQFAACYQSIADSVRYHNTGTLKACDSTPPSTFRYRPSDADCNGNSSVVLTGDLFDTFSIQIRYPDGTDRLDEGCETASCSPYKTQDTIRVEGIKVLCFGTPGNSVIMSDMNHVSIKREGDDHDPLRYCVPDPKLPIN